MMFKLKTCFTQKSSSDESFVNGIAVVFATVDTQNYLFI